MWAQYSLLIQSRTNEHLSCSCFLAIIHSAINLLHIQVLCRSVFISPRSRLGHIFAVLLAFWGTVKLFSKGAELLYPQHRSVKKSWLYPHWHLALTACSAMAVWKGMHRHYNVTFMGHFPKNQWCHHFREMLVWILHPFLNQGVFYCQLSRFFL